MENEYKVVLPKLNMGQPEVSMAPLIDVVFLLLIFFIVTTVFPEEGITIEKPTSEQATRLNEHKIVISIDNQGEIYINTRHYSPTALGAFVKAALLKKPDSTVVIRADKNSLTEQLIAVIDICKGAGVGQLAIATAHTSVEPAAVDNE